ncbi:MAG TPA: phosphodiester glycosidase family protein [Actinomycetota bacterium]
MRSILISLALVILLPAAPGVPAPAPVVAGGLIPGVDADEAIAFGSTAGGRREVRLALAGTAADLGTITPAGYRGVEPAWSEDGTTIAFARKAAGAATHLIHAVSAEGGTASRVTSGATDDRQPAWAPSGRLAFVRADPIRGTSRIMSVNQSGTGLRQVTGKGSSSRRDATPTWSPDGSLIAFVRAEGGYPRLSTIGADGKGRIEIAPDPACADANPSWSEAGIVFDRMCDGGPPDLFLVQPAGEGWSEPVNLTNTPAIAEFDADWSPDEARVVFSTHADGDGNADLAVMQVPSGPPVPLIISPTSEMGADWHHFARPDGEPCSRFGTMQSETVTGTPGNDVLCALGGDDVLEGGLGHDVIRGGGGTDTASYAGASGGVTVDLSETGPQDTGAGTDTLAGIENLTGSPRNDVLTGNGGPNVLTGGPGNDILTGGGGTDTASYADASGGVTVDLSETGPQDTGAGTDTLGGIENLTGSPQDDVLTGNGGPNVLIGGEGGDSLTGGAGTDTASYASSTIPVQASLAAGSATSGAWTDTLDGIENLIGGSAGDTLTGSDAGNRLEGGPGSDTLAGLGGNDLLIGGDGDDTLDGGDGHDRLLGEGGSDHLAGGGGDDDLTGGSASDHLDGGSGDDTLAGGGGDDHLEGGPGRDRLAGDSGNDRLEGGDGADRLYGGSGEDILLGEAGGDVLAGQDGQDRLTGGSGADRLSGGAGNDRLSARDRARDRVHGGSGKDRGSVDRRDVVASLESAKRSRRFRTRSTRVASGIVLKKIRDRRGPRRIFALTVAPGGGRRTDTALAGDELRGFERTSTMANRHRAIAAVNGDFGLPSGRPAHHFSMDGDLKQTSDAYGYHFAMSADGTRTFMGHRGVTLDSLITPRGERWDVARWNDGGPGTGEIAGVAGTSGGLEKAPQHACSARLEPVDPQAMRWTEDGAGVESDHTVTAVSCGAQALAMEGGIVLSARPSAEQGAFLRGMDSDQILTLSWSMGWPGVLDALGGYPQLIRAGKVVAGSCSASLCKRHPRTGVGMRPDGTVMLVVVDGRRKRWSKGMTLKQFARQFERLGAEWALNLDGGGSSTMWIRGRGIVNRPSDRRERQVSSALLVLNGPDGGEPALLSAGGEGQAAPPAPAAAISLDAGDVAALDPGSTGGLLEALAEGVFDPAQELGGELRQALRSFRASLGG